MLATTMIALALILPPGPEGEAIADALDRARANADARAYEVPLPTGTTPATEIVPETVPAGECVRVEVGYFVDPDWGPQWQIVGLEFEGSWRVDLVGPYLWLMHGVDIYELRDIEANPDEGWEDYSTTIELPEGPQLVEVCV